MLRVARPFLDYGGYRPWTVPWLKSNIQRYTTGLFRSFKTFYLRARYGWAPRDTWSLDAYLSGVLAGSLYHLADNKHGAPACYPKNRDGIECACKDMSECQTDFAQWEADLKRWAKVFHDYQDEGSLHKMGAPEMFLAEQERMKAVQQALKEMAPYWGALWD